MGIVIAIFAILAALFGVAWVLVVRRPPAPADPTPAMEQPIPQQKDKKEDQWQLAKITGNDGKLRGSRLFNMDALAHKSHCTLLHYVTFTYKGRALPTQSEFDRFNKIDDLIQSTLSRLGGVNAAVITMNGKRDWICYTPDGVGAADALRAALKGFGPDIETQRDPMWTQYQDLKDMGP